jgi:hypothetical protein
MLVANNKGGFMPDIKIKQEVEYEVNIDVYCGTCGNGLCRYTDVNDRRMSFTVEACPHCMAEKDEKIKELESIIDELKSAACI